MMEVKEFIKRVIRECLNEDVEKKNTRLSFKNSTDLHRADMVLYKNGYKRPTSSNIGSGYYKVDDNWLNIEFDKKYEDDILKLLNGINFELKYVKPMEYKIFNHGGYLD